MKAFSVNHITHFLHCLQSNGLAEKYMQILKCLFYKTTEEGKDLYKCLMFYCNTPISSRLQLPMQILQGRSARYDLPMSNAARKQLGIQPKAIRNIHKHEALPTHNLHAGQSVIYQHSVTKQWHPAIITSLYQEKRSYMVTTSDGPVYRKMQAYLKPYTPQNMKSQAVQCVSQPMAQSDYMQPVKQSDHKKSSQVNNQLQVHTSRPKRDTKPPVKIDFKYFNVYLVNMDIYIVYISVFKWPCNGIPANESLIYTCMYVSINQII